MVDPSIPRVPHNFIDLSGQVFGRLTVIDRAQNARGRARWQCHCICGTDKIITAKELRNGSTRSCGCLERESRYSHGHAVHGHRTPEYNSWGMMVQRCHNPKATEYSVYGGRGIAVCERWRESFEAFLADMGPRPPKTSLDRFPNVHGNYEPGNCRWAGMKEQHRNRGNNRMLTHNGITQCVSAWSEVSGIPETSLRGRLKNGWTVERALTTPTDVSKRHHHG